VFYRDNGSEVGSYTQSQYDYVDEPDLANADVTVSVTLTERSAPDDGEVVVHVLFANKWRMERLYKVDDGLGWRDATLGAEGEAWMKLIRPDGTVAVAYTFNSDGTVGKRTVPGEIKTIESDVNGHVTNVTTDRADDSELVYIRYTPNSLSPTRKRVTTVTFNSDDDSGGTRSIRMATTIFGYYTSGDDAGKLEFIVEPDGVARFLSDNIVEGTPTYTGPDPDISTDAPGNACDLDTVASGALDDYASTYVSDYDDTTGDIETVKRGQGCGGCTSAGSGEYTYSSSLVSNNESYDAELAAYPIEDEEYHNVWQTARTTEMPSGARKVEFLNCYGAVVYEVLQEMSDTTIDRQWTTHYKYNSDGKIREHRYPSACTTYTEITSDGWTTDPSTVVDNTRTANEGLSGGLVRYYEYDDENGKRDAEKVSKGGGTAYYVRSWTYETREVGAEGEETYTYWVATSTEYPSPGTTTSQGDARTTHYRYTFFSDTHAINVKEVIYPLVEESENGPGGTPYDTEGGPLDGDNPREVYHYVSDTTNNLYHNDWTRHADGSLSYTGVDEDGRVMLSVRDVQTSGAGLAVGFVDPLTDAAPTAPDYGTQWANTEGQSLVTIYSYDGQGRPETVTAPDDSVTEYAYMCQQQVLDGQETYDGLNTVGRVTLTAPFVDSTDYSLAPIQISISKYNGSVSASGHRSSTADSLDEVWDKTATSTAMTIKDAFGGDLISRSETINKFDDPEVLVGTFRHRYHKLPANGGEGDMGTNYCRTVTLYDNNTGWTTYDIMVAEGTDGSTLEDCVEVVTKYTYDQLGRVTKTERGVSDADDDLTATPELYDDISISFAIVSKTFYDESTPGSGTSGSTDVGDGYVTSSLRYFGAGGTNAEATQAIRHYDHRGRLRGLAQAGWVTSAFVTQSPYVVYDVDNTGRQAAAAQFISEPTWSTVLTKWFYAQGLENDGETPLADTNRRTLNTTLYDKLGRVYRTERYEVSSSGVKGDNLTTNNYYRGRDGPFGPPPAQIRT